MTRSNLEPERDCGRSSEVRHVWRAAGWNRARCGGLAGRGIADAIDTAAEKGYWRDNFSSRPYVEGGSTLEVYGPAYRFGVDSYARLGNHSFEQVEPELEREWERAKGGSQLSWASAKDAARDAWQHVSDAIERVTPGDSDRDGK